jgi:pseudaminic acid cytidylyltransferase
LKTIAIIPARGGSKRIPQKNIKEFLGKPIIAYAIQKAMDSGLFHTIVVSTDDEAVKKVALAYGAEVPFMRSAENANDHATTFDALQEVLENYRKLGETFDEACCIYPCSPLLEITSLQKAKELLSDKKFDCVFPIVPFSFPIQRALRMNAEAQVAFLEQETALTRTQDLEKFYHDSGQFYYFNVQQILKKGLLLTDNSGSIVLDELDVQDIDVLSDWKIAEIKYQLKHG